MQSSYLRMAWWPAQSRKNYRSYAEILTMITFPLCTFVPSNEISWRWLHCPIGIGRLAENRRSLHVEPVGGKRFGNQGRKNARQSSAHTCAEMRAILGFAASSTTHLHPYIRSSEMKRHSTRSGASPWHTNPRTRTLNLQRLIVGRRLQHILAHKVSYSWASMGWTGYTHRTHADKTEKAA